MQESIKNNRALVELILKAQKISKALTAGSGREK